jgi:hypothetical protein
LSAETLKGVTKITSVTIVKITPETGLVHCGSHVTRGSSIAKVRPGDVQRLDGRLSNAATGVLGIVTP